MCYTLGRGCGMRHSGKKMSCRLLVLRPQYRDPPRAIGTKCGEPPASPVAPMRSWRSGRGGRRGRKLPFLSFSTFLLPLAILRRPEEAAPAAEIDDVKVERQDAKGWWGRKWPLRALQFSILSAFLGWRELNVGTWLARVQTREYTRRATGWVWAVAGAQSLLSIHLLAMWALTYFGRPFG
jgi:hypothetical protein